MKILYKVLGPLAAPLLRRHLARRRQAMRDRRALRRRVEAFRAGSPERTQLLSLAELRQKGVIGQKGVIE